MPVILTGILNMLFCSLPVLPGLQKPLDGGRLAADGRRVFGDNKTWKGLVGYVVLGAVTALLWGWLCDNQPDLAYHNLFYEYRENTPLYNLILGTALGLIYALCELPNSYSKRRLGIESGKTPAGTLRFVFVFFDQADSLIGCVFLLFLLSDIGWLLYLFYVLLGAATHLLINAILYLLHLRRSPL
jgi:CDP-diglyceride synthetase